MTMLLGEVSEEQVKAGGPGRQTQQTAHPCRGCTLMICVVQPVGLLAKLAPPSTKEV